MKIAPPLLFVVIETNVDYQVVATFVTEIESLGSRAETLLVIKQWNLTCKPR